MSVPIVNTLVCPIPVWSHDEPYYGPGFTSRAQGLHGNFDVVPVANGGDVHRNIDRNFAAVTAKVNEVIEALTAVTAVLTTAGVITSD